ncbi:MAG: hypothetical protein H6993_01955 [Pseudomonadales bacterium]|nr:hypothetical protein [Pseudomonadales bacterium]
MFRIGRYPFGFSHDVIESDGRPYLERWILHCGGTLRVHRFLSSDEDRAVHDHPWWFVTLPFTAYAEYVTEGDHEVRRVVRPFRLHFRPARFQHRVELLRAPTWTVILTGPKRREWGFWPQDRFVHNRDWESQGPGA